MRKWYRKLPCCAMPCLTLCRAVLRRAALCRAVLCSEEEVRKSYRKLALRYHPDKALANCKFAVKVLAFAAAAAPAPGGPAPSAGASGSSGPAGGSGNGNGAAAPLGRSSSSGLGNGSSGGDGGGGGGGLALAGVADIEARVREEAAWLFNLINQVGGGVGCACVVVPYSPGGAGVWVVGAALHASRVPKAKHTTSPLFCDCILFCFRELEPVVGPTCRCARSYYLACSVYCTVLFVWAERGSPVGGVAG